MLKLKPVFQFPPSNELRIDEACDLFDFLMPEVFDALIIFEPSRYVYVVL